MSAINRVRTAVFVAGLALALPAYAQQHEPSPPSGGGGDGGAPPASGPGDLPAPHEPGGRPPGEGGAGPIAGANSLWLLFFGVATEADRDGGRCNAIVSYACK